MTDESERMNQTENKNGIMFKLRSNSNVATVLYGATVSLLEAIILYASYHFLYFLYTMYIYYEHI